MELVYLWVEDYKNIHNQGFNFSPRFICDYDEEKKELTIDKNDDYIPDFFGENINVTAIVGKNGSGKSSVGEILATFSHQEYLDKKSFLVFFDNESFIFKQSYTKYKLTFNVINKTSYGNETTNKARTIDIVYFANSISTIFNNPRLYNIEKYHNIDAFKDHYEYDMPNNKYGFSRKKTQRMETFNNRLQNLLSEDENLLSEISNKMIFDSYKIELHFYEIGTYFVNDKDFLKLLKKTKLEGLTVFNETDNPQKKLCRFLLLFRLVLYKKDYQKDIASIVDKIKEQFNKEDFSADDLIEINKIVDVHDDKSTIYTRENIENIISSFVYYKDEIWIEKRSHNISDNFTANNTLLELLIKYINRTNFYNSKDPNYNYFSLSSGEREYLDLFIAYIYHIKRISSELSGSSNKFIFLFDEPDLGLHPDWQKRMVYDLVSYAKKNIKKNFQIILTSHSPFLLSDTPKQNIIFLDTYQEDDIEVKNKNQKVGYCKVLKHDKVLKKKQTFGANIHTLLSDSFFMDNGLMGEFAKDKINEIIDFFNGKNEVYGKDKERLKKIIETIGEPFLKDKLLRMHDEKYPKTKEEEIAELKAKIERLENG